MDYDLPHMLPEWGQWLLAIKMGEILLYLGDIFFKLDYHFDLLVYNLLNNHMIFSAL